MLKLVLDYLVASKFMRITLACSISVAIVGGLAILALRLDGTFNI
jgi:hypothetical protein